MKQIVRGPELNIEKPHDLEVIGYGIESEPNTVVCVLGNDFSVCSLG